MTGLGRRELLIGLACTAAAAGAQALRPRRRVSLLGDRRLEEQVPTAFKGWRVQPTSALVVPDDEDSLAARLYSQVIGRLYVHPEAGAVMLLIAYGDTQNDLLQLHRPEVCYPAFGFALHGNRRVEVDLGRRARLPARALTAAGNDRVEQILYWTRIGEHLPTNGREQRLDKLDDQFAGIVPDGVLVRISSLGSDPETAFAVNARFARALVGAVPPAARPALVGSALAARLGG